MNIWTDWVITLAAVIDLAKLALLLCGLVLAYYILVHHIAPRTKSVLRRVRVKWRIAELLQKHSHQESSSNSS